MHCVNHPEVDAQSFCQNCGKPLCNSCVRTNANSQIFCEACLAATGGDPSQAYWQSAAQAGTYPPPPRGNPNPNAAAFLGLIPGVGAMYNGQLFKGLIHVIIFAVLVSIADHFKIFVLFVFAWVIYQSFEAFHTAKARRDGLPVPDPFGLNEVGSWINLSGLGLNPNQAPGVPPTPSAPPPSGATPGAQTVYEQPTSTPPPYSAPYSSTWTGSEYQPPPYSAPFVGAYPPGSMPPIPPVPPPNMWRRREPIWAIVMIVLGLIFLLQSMGFVSDIFAHAWPVLLIGIGVWLIIRRIGNFQGGSK